MRCNNIMVMHEEEFWLQSQYCVIKRGIAYFDYMHTLYNKNMLEDECKMIVDIILIYSSWMSNWECQAC